MSTQIRYLPDEPRRALHSNIQDETIADGMNSLGKMLVKHLCHGFAIRLRDQLRGTHIAIAGEGTSKAKSPQCSGERGDFYS